MEDTCAIEVNHISKSFKIFLDKGHEIKDYITSSKRMRYENREVLRDISFKVKKGEAIGLIGQNGCGKSTTLKLLSRIMYPDSGTIKMNGRVSSLIELGAGFHPDMSGRENIYINASIFGLSRKEIDARLNDIIAFSELEDFIDNPVRTYSSGMYMRLAFSVAINVDADILLIDEILAVGDVNFQAKCFNRLREIKAEGTTIVIVSHSMGQIEQICEHSIWIHDGLVRAEGSPRDVHPEYLDYMGAKRQENAVREGERRVAKKNEEASETAKSADTAGNASDHSAEGSDTQQPAPDEEKPAEKEIRRWGNGKARITDIELSDGNGQPCLVFRTGQDITARLRYTVKEKVENAVFGIAIYRADGIHCYGSNTRLDGVHQFDLAKDGEVEIKMKNVMLMPGQYILDFAIEADMGIPVDFYRDAVTVRILSSREDVGLVRVEHEWRMDKT